MIYRIMRNSPLILGLLMGFLAYPLPVLADGLSGYFELQPRAFFEDPTQATQRRDSISFALEPQFALSWDGGRQAITARVFGRVDSADSQRTHLDIRELNWVGAWGPMEIQAGVARVFWGVTESQHLVDVINQTDLVENFDGEQKLGQPLLRLSLLGVFGDLHLYALPYFRARTFAGTSGRLKLQPPGGLGDAKLKQWHPSAAVRWERSQGPFDFGLSYYYGTSRDPIFVATDGAATPLYALIHQVALDLQATIDALLIKHEAIYRFYEDNAAPQPDFYAQTSGLEYTLYGAVADIDISILFEYLWASKTNFLSPFDNHIFVGMRWGLNDTQGTQILAGGVIDLEAPSLFFNLEASRRLSQELSAALEVRYFRLRGTSRLAALRKDSYLQLQLRYGF